MTGVQVLTIMPPSLPSKLLYTSKPEGCMNDCDYEKTVWFLCQAGLVDNTSGIMVAFWRDAIGENSAGSVSHLMELLILSTLCSPVRYISSVYIKEVQDTMSVNLHLILKCYQALAAVAGRSTSEPWSVKHDFLFKY